MNYALDTNAAIAVINDNPQVRARFTSALSAGADVLLPTVVLFELRFGIMKSAKRELNQALLNAFLLQPVAVAPFQEDDADVAAQIRFALKTRGTPIGPYDLLIAAQALRTDSTLVTANEREFRRVDGLKIENWEAPARRR